MPTYDRAYVDSAMKRCASIEPDAEPEWGVMSPAQMRAHIKTAVRYSLGKEELSPDERNWFVNTFLLPLILSGLVKLPKNAARPKLYDAAPPEATDQEVQAELEEFLTAYESADFKPPNHPSLGDLGPTGWAKLHAIHFDHHLRQFGV